MSNFIIFTDTACDLPASLLAEKGIRTIELTFRFTSEDTEYTNGAIPPHDFYDRMRKGEVAKTAAINTETFVEAFEGTLKEGLDVLYVGFSSGLSNTYNASVMAAKRLSEQYPDRKCLTVDSLCASSGQGLLAVLAADKCNAGASIEETAAYAEQIKMSICHWFTVDDLVYLKRGGRISPFAAFAGNLIGIKPVLKVDNEGHLINTAKVRGRKTALATLVSKCTDTIKENSPVYISHGDTPEEAANVAAMIGDKLGRKADLITDIGPVIGAHSGPGTIAVFFLANER